jgi:hypothetical protein
MINVTVKVKFEHDEEFYHNQEYHDFRIQNFKDHLTSLLEGYTAQITSIINIEYQYNPDTRKFSLLKLDNKDRQRHDYVLIFADGFRKEFLQL